MNRDMISDLSTLFVLEAFAADDKEDFDEAARLLLIAEELHAKVKKLDALEARKAACA